MPDRFQQLQSRLAKYGCELQPINGGWAVMLHSEMLTYRRDLDSIEALLLASTEIEALAQRFAKEIVNATG